MFACLAAARGLRRPDRPPNGLAAALVTQPRAEAFRLTVNRLGDVVGADRLHVAKIANRCRFP